MKLYPDVVYEDIREAYREDLVDPMFIDLENVDEILARGKERVLEEQTTDPRHRFIEDTIQQMEWWAAFQPSQPSQLPPVIQKPTGQVVREGRKIGRNEPCPCGSGLKYKRCCGKGR